MNVQIRLFQALADPARLGIVETMKTGERAVGDIVERMNIHQSGVSRHLRILSEAGLVQMRPDGQKRLYSLRKEAFDQIDTWMAGYRRHWEKRLDRLGEALEGRHALRARHQEKS
ncbi:MAG: winged helix-turn-helix transcriptional regulator [Acidobacteria bacterium]|nr:winged helix-turn-helix transcriptional regulator [Acidobacteriota bacterium]